MGRHYASEMILVSNSRGAGFGVFQNGWSIGVVSTTIDKRALRRKEKGSALQ
jgi:hypothetical protein